MMNLHRHYIKSFEFSWFLLLFFILALASCVKVDSADSQGDQDKDNYFPSGMMVPTKSGTLTSNEPVPRFILQWAEGTVDMPTTVSISILSKSNFSDLPLLVSDVYQVEPSHPLNKDVRITFDLTDLMVGEKNISEYYGLKALAFREISPTGRPVYIDALETKLSEDAGSPKVFQFQTNQPKAYGVFLHECYLLCEERINCPDFELDPSKPKSEQIQSCITKLGCYSDLDKANTDMAPVFDCVAREKSCNVTFGCCLESPYCQEVSDGDEQEQELDGDLDAEMEQEPEHEAEREEEGPPEWLPVLCESNDSCNGNVCLIDDYIDSEKGRCVAATSQPVELFNRGETSWESKGNTPQLGCMGKLPSSEENSPKFYDLKVKVSSWWLLKDDSNQPYLDGIRVEYFNEINEGVFDTATTDVLGEATLADIPTNEWFYLRSSRGAKQGQSVARDVIPTYEYGLFVTYDVAKAAQNQGKPVEIEIHPIDRSHYDYYLNIFSAGAGATNTNGMFIGQFNDCTGYTIKNAVLGFKEVTPLKTMYFYNNEMIDPQPGLNGGASENGFVASLCHLLTGDQNQYTAFISGTVTGVSFPQLFGLTMAGHFKLHKDSVTILRFNRFQ